MTVEELKKKLKFAKMGLAEATKEVEKKGYQDKIDAYEAQIAELEASEKAPAGKASAKEKPVKTPKAKATSKGRDDNEDGTEGFTGSPALKRKKRDLETLQIEYSELEQANASESELQAKDDEIEALKAEIADMSDAEAGKGSAKAKPTAPSEKWKPDNTKGEAELSCEKLIRDAKAERNKNTQSGLIKIIQTQKKSTKGEFSKEKLEEKTVQQLREMAGFSKPRTGRLLDNAKRAFDDYSKVPVKSFVQKAETPEKRKEVAEKAAQLQEKYAKEIATFVKEKELELKNELENLLK